MWLTIVIKTIVYHKRIYTIEKSKTKGKKYFRGHITRKARVLWGMSRLTSPTEPKRLGYCGISLGEAFSKRVLSSKKFHARDVFVTFIVEMTAWQVIIFLTHAFLQTSCRLSFSDIHCYIRNKANLGPPLTGDSFSAWRVLFSLNFS